MTVAHDDPDYVDVVIHSYRRRLGLADGPSAVGRSAAPARRTAVAAAEMELVKA